MRITSGHRNTRLRVAVLQGGPSAERAISLQSGAAVAVGLASRGHHVVLLDPLEVDLVRYDWTGIDVAFIALHGKFGEDGQVQQLLETAGVPYTGSDSQASRVAISKSASKERFRQNGVPTAPYVLIHETDTPDRISELAAQLGFPLVVKPDAQGSSLGVTIVAEPGALTEALGRCFQYDSFGILEQAIIGSEWTAGLLDDLPLPLIRIATNRAFFDFQAKYEDNGTEYQFDFAVANDVVQRIGQTARNACAALGTRGLARVDVMLDKIDRPWVLEVNTVPGLTDHSLVPKAAARLGVDFPELCDRCLASALANSPGALTPRSS